jgi:hypothetical protein
MVESATMIWTTSKFRQTSSRFNFAIIASCLVAFSFVIFARWRGSVSFGAGSSDVLTVTGSTGDELTWDLSSYADTKLNIQHLSLHRHNKEVTPELLILLITQDSDSWGTMPDGTPRSFASLLALLHEVSIDFTRTSLGILTSSRTEYDLYHSLSMKEPFARVSTILHPGYLSPADAISRADRHYNHVQHKRRNEISRLRNYLMLHALEREQHVVWIDADVYKFTNGLIPAMIDHSADPEVGVITVLSLIGEREDSDFDLNCWVGPRTSPSEEEKARLLEDVSSWVASPAPGNRGMSDLVKSHGDDNDLFRLDAVGGTFLYIRASLVRQGLSWAYSYIVGTSWAGEGWDAIESESLCLLARPLGAYCYGMGGRWRSHHSPG